MGKTTMAVAFSKVLGLEYGRVQFTPDTLPSDITGFAVYNKDTGKFTFNKGAVFCNLFLADGVKQNFKAELRRLCLRQWKNGRLLLKPNLSKLEKALFCYCNAKPDKE